MTIRFSITPEENAIIEHEAKARGLSKSQFAKEKTFHYINKYPAKGVFAELLRLKEEREND